MTGTKLDLENVQFKDKNQAKQYVERKEGALVKKGNGKR